MDFDANKTLTGGLALQTMETYKEFIDTDDISFGGNGNQSCRIAKCSLDIKWRLIKKK